MILIANLYGMDKKKMLNEKMCHGDMELKTALYSRRSFIFPYKW